MKLEDFKAITSKIAQNLSNQGLVTELLDQLNDGYTQVSTNIDNFTKQESEYKGQIESLQKTNMNLFLKLGNPTPDNLLRGNPEPENKLTYENLLNEWDKGAN